MGFSLLGGKVNERGRFCAGQKVLIILILSDLPGRKRDPKNTDYDQHGEEEILWFEKAE